MLLSKSYIMKMFYFSVSGAPVPPAPSVGFENIAGPSVPPSNMTFSTDSGLFPTPGAHAPPSTPQDPPRAGQYQPSQQPGGSSYNPASSSQPSPSPRTTLAAAASSDWKPPPNPGEFV